MFDIAFEKKLFSSGRVRIGAIDEAGRGPLAGPVVACCLAVSPADNYPQKLLEEVKDSKKLSPKKREQIYTALIDNFEFIGIGICDHKTIDRINILEASFLAMKKAITEIRQRPDFIIVDGSHVVPNLSLPQKAVIRGDSLIFSIAAASIIAKVTRDRIMLEMHKKYPLYNFAQHKGYGTREHMEIIKRHGPSPIHRQSFRPVKDYLRCS